MRVLVTGGTGAIGKFLLPLLVENKHEVVALTRSVTKAEQLEHTGVFAVIVDPLDKPRLTAAGGRSQPPGGTPPATPVTQDRTFRDITNEVAMTNRVRTQSNRDRAGG